MQMSTFQSELVFGESGFDAVGRRLGNTRPGSQTGRGSKPVAVKDKGGWPQNLISAARDGDGQAFQGLVEGNWGSAVRLARSIMQTEEGAADAVQEALIKVHRAMPRFKDGNFRGWLLRIVSNTCYDHLRSQKRRSALSLDQMIEESDYEVSEWSCEQDPERYALRREQLAGLGRLIDGLPTWYRDVVVLVDVHGYDYGEAAAYLRLPRGTVKSRLSRARARLRDQLAAVDLLS